jgi:hypothetical protein
LLSKMSSVLLLFGTQPNDATAFAMR